MRKLIVFLLFACCATFGQQTNSDIIPATSGLNLGHSNQRWNGYFQNLDINGTCTVNGFPCLGAGSGGNGITITNAAGLATVPGKQNGTIAVITDGLTSSDCTVGGGIASVACQFNGTTWSQLPGGSSVNFAAPPPLGNITPNSVSATSVQVAANGFLMTPDLSCLFHGSDPSLDQFSDVNGVPTWITSGLICQSALLYTPLGPGVNPLLGTVPAYVPGSQSFVIGAPATFPNGIAPPAYTVATLPTSATVPAIITGSIALVTDAATVGSCTVGGGANYSLCTWNGSSWQSVGNGAAARVRSCDIALGDGANAIPAATYSALVGCRNDTGQTLTITAVKCFEDAGTSTCDAKTSHAGTPDILTGAISASNAWAAGTQSATTSVLTTEWMTGTIVADGTSKRIVLHIVGTL